MIDLEIIETIVKLDNGKNGTLELNRVIVNGKDRLFDLGAWTLDGKRKGGTFITYSQLQELKKVICDL